ncbi:MAG: PadR family transcriptional regulator [Clostridia bacterium]|nr:PadR family transcriptional regulator [Clostridia bacterium]MDD7672008.1 PadR family transcriptional regulator [Clostridia bacterium]MDY2930385.1 PadR family transcriptional regulator [Clostridiaceae bacterium]
MSLTSDLIRGHTETVILAQLLDHDSYGYEINKSIRERSGGEYEAKEGTLYTAFRRLEQAGYIRSYWGDETSGARRRYYSITDEGRAVFEERKAEWQRVRTILSALIEGEQA